MLTYLIFGLSLVGLSALLIGRHLHVWRHEKHQTRGPQQAYLRRQTVRRLQTSFLLGLSGVVVIAAGLLPETWLPIALLLLLCLIVWILMLATADFLHTRHHYHQQRHEIGNQKAQLECELGRLEQHEKNGHSQPDSLPGEES